MGELRTQTSILSTRARLGTFISQAGKISLYVELRWEGRVKMVLSIGDDALAARLWADWPVGKYADIECVEDRLDGQVQYTLIDFSNVSQHSAGI